MKRLCVLAGKQAYWEKLVASDALLSKGLRDFSTGHYPSSDLKKIKKKNNANLHAPVVYRLKLNHTARVLLSFLPPKNQPTLLGYIPDHRYNRSNILNSNEYKVNCDANEGVWVDNLDLDDEGEEVSEMEFTSLTVGMSPFFEKFGAVVPSLNDWVTLDNLQEESTSLKKPAIIEGVPGAGKTTLGQAFLAVEMEALLERQRNGMYKPGKKICYVAASQGLVNKARVECGQYGYSEDQIEFITISDLLKKNFLNLNLVGDAHFTDWYARRIRINNKLLYSPNDIEKELSACEVYPLEKYLCLGRKQSRIDRADRAEIYQIYKEYKAHLAATNCQNEYLCQSLLNETTASYDFTFVDEYQDLNYSQLRLVTALTRPGNIIYSGDKEQNVKNSFRADYYLNDLYHQAGLQLNRLELPKSYRLPVKIARTCNIAKNLQSALNQGEEKGATTRINEVDENNGIGATYFVSLDQLANSPFIKQEKGPGFAVVTTEDYLEEARVLFGCDLVHTAETIKGLEYPIVVLYKFLDEPFFKEAKRTIDAKGGVAHASRHRPKEKKAATASDQYCDSLYTVLSRSTKTIIVCDKRTNNNALFLDPYKELCDSGSLTERLMEQSYDSAINWEAQAWALWNSPASKGMAAMVYQKKLGWSESMWQQFVEEKQGIKKKRDEENDGGSSEIKAPQQAQVDDVVGAGSIQGKNDVEQAQTQVLQPLQADVSSSKALEDKGKAELKKSRRGRKKGKKQESVPSPKPQIVEEKQDVSKISKIVGELLFEKPKIRLKKNQQRSHYSPYPPVARANCGESIQQNGTVVLRGNSLLAESEDRRGVVTKKLDSQTIACFAKSLGQDFTEPRVAAVLKRCADIQDILMIFFCNHQFKDGRQGELLGQSYEKNNSIFIHAIMKNRELLERLTINHLPNLMGLKLSHSMIMLKTFKDTFLGMIEHPDCKFPNSEQTNTPAIIAILNNHMPLIQLALDMDAYSDEKELSILISYAIHWGKHGLLQLICKNIKNLNDFCVKPVDELDVANSELPLVHLAVKRGTLATLVTLTTDLRLDIGKTINGETVIHYAIRYSNRGALEWSLKVNPNLLDIGTPLSLVVEQKDPLSLEIILRYATPSLIQKEGKAAVLLAIRRGNTAAVDMLKKVLKKHEVRVTKAEYAAASDPTRDEGVFASEENMARFIQENPTRLYDLVKRFPEQKERIYDLVVESVQNRNLFIKFASSEKIYELVEIFPEHQGEIQLLLVSALKAKEIALQNQKTPALRLEARLAETITSDSGESLSRLLREHPININELVIRDGNLLRPLVFFALRWGGTKVLEVLKTAKVDLRLLVDGLTVVHDLLFAGRTNNLEWLVKAEPVLLTISSDNKDIGSPLFYAAYLGQMQSIELILHYLNLRSPDLVHHEGRAAVFCLAEKGERGAEGLDLLLQALQKYKLEFGQADYDRFVELAPQMRDRVKLKTVAADVAKAVSKGLPEDSQISAYSQVFFQKKKEDPILSHQGSLGLSS